MANRRRRSVGVLVLGVGAVAITASSPAWGPDLARKIEWLEVRRVEITGTRLLAPHEVLQASGIVRGRHLLDDHGSAEAALAEHPVIASALIERRPPHTLRVRIREEVPVALLSDDRLRFATADGKLLPVDPSTVPLDLPIVRGSMSDSTAAERTRRALAETDRLIALDPGFMRQISEIRPLPEDPDALVLEHGSAQLVIPFGISALRLGELRQVLADVERRYTAFAADSAVGRHRLDLRYSDQVVVRPSLPRELS